MPDSINQAVHSLREMNDRFCLRVETKIVSSFLLYIGDPKCLKNKARSKALHQTFSEIIPEMDKALNKQLLEVLMKYTERDNELIVILNEDGPNIIELKSLKPVSLLAEKLSAYSSYYHVDVVELVVKKIDFEGAYKLLKASPDVPLLKA